MSDPADYGRQPERTRLAWQRTTLSALIGLLAVERLVAEVSGAVTLIIGGLALVALAAPTWSLIRSKRRSVDDGIRLLVLAAITVFGGLAAIAYALAA